MSRAHELEQGRKALRRQEWRAAYAQLSAAEEKSPLDPRDLEALAVATFLIGKDAEAADFLARAHQRFLGEGNAERAARCAIWQAFALLSTGALAQAGGWLARARRLLDDGLRDCVEQGYLLVPAGIMALREGDAGAAYTAFTQAVAAGEKFGDTDLVTLARQAQGRALIQGGETARGISLLDEAMVAVTAGEVSPIIAGGIYCSVIEVCSQIFDLRRAQEWTSALQRWCASQPDMVHYRSHCLVRRAEILQLHGDWQGALDEAKRACEQPAPGEAFYRVGEVQRLRGDFATAEAAYRQAGQLESRPRPGLALLRLAQGQIDAAVVAVRLAADEVRDDCHRPAMLDAFAEIMLAARDAGAARTASDELSGIAARIRAPLLDAMSARVSGGVLLAEQDARGALTVLRRAMEGWRELAAPYEAARTRVLIALACRAHGTGDAADIELEDARAVFRQLGAAPDLERVEGLLSVKSPRPDGPLTGREVEVLRLVASGMTNREIAARLSISEKTVARHISNIFTKLDLPSRAAATAYAYQHGLAGSAST